MNGINNISEKIEKLIIECRDNNIKTLAIAIYDTRKCISEIKDDIKFIKYLITVSFTIITFLISIVTFIYYLKH